MIRVLNVISALNNAGTEAVVMNYYRNIDRSQVQFDFLVLNEGSGYYEDEINAMGGKIYKIPAFTQNPLKCIIERKKFFRNHHYDIVEVHSPSALRYAYCKLARKSGAKKVIFHIHNYSDSESGLVKYARKQIEKYCDEIVTCSQTAALSVMGKSADKVIYNAINYDLYKYDEKIREKVHRRLGIADNEKVVGHIGRFSDQKNTLFLLEIFSKAAAINKSLKLIMKGFGEMEADVRNKIVDLVLDRRVILADDEFTAAELYNAFDLFVLPSKYEGLGIVTIEAQANGLRAIVSANITKECDISGYVTFVELSEEKWVGELLRANNYTRIPNDFDFKSTEYDIGCAAQKRQIEYMEMASDN